MDRGRDTRSDESIRVRHRSGPCRGEGGSHRVVVEWSDRRTKHKTEDDEAPDVWQGRPRPAAGPSSGRSVIGVGPRINYAPEPLLDADYPANGGLFPC